MEILNFEECYVKNLICHGAVWLTSKTNNLDNDMNVESNEQTFGR